MREEVRILHAEALEHGFVPVGAAVAIRVAVEANLGAMLHERAVAIRQHAERDREAGGKHARLARLLRPRLVDHEHLVAAAGRKENTGSLGCFVAIDGIFERGRRPQPAVGIERQGDEFPVGIRGIGALGQDQFGAEPVGQ